MTSFAFLAKCKHLNNLVWCLTGFTLIYLNCFISAQNHGVDYVVVKGNDSIDVFYNGHLDNVTLFTKYNRNLNKLQYVIEWKHFAPGRYSINVVPLPPCPIQAEFLDYLNKTTTTYYIPPSETHDFQLHKNCAYDIEIKAYGHVLNIISHIPDYRKINGTYIKAQNIFLYQIYNNTIDRIQYVMKWKDSTPDDAYEVSVFPKTSNDYYYCGSSAYNYRANKNNTVLYIPSTLTSNFELHANCGYIIEMNAKGQKLNISSYISDNVQVKQILLKTIYNESIHKIQYVISWRDTAPDTYSISVVVHQGSKSIHCDERPYESFDLNSNISDYYIPPTSDYDFKLEGNCTYEIEVHYEDTKKTILNTIPVCVGSECNCKILYPKPNTPPSIEENEGSFNISWSFPEIQENNITDIGFYFFDASCASNINSTEIKPKVLERNYAILESENVTDGQYCISISFINSYGCSYSYSDIKEVSSSLKSSDGMKWFHMLIAVTISAPIFMVVYCYFSTFHRSFYKIWGRITRPTRTTESRRTELNLLYIPMLDVPKDKYEIPREKIRLVKVIGMGAFGEVYSAKLGDLTKSGYVAVKRLREKATPEERQDFSSEIDILKKIGDHPNIVKLIGYCTLKEPNMMIMEYVPCGDLKQYLLDLRNEWGQGVRKSSSVNSVFTSRSSAYIVPDTPNTPDTPSTSDARISTSTQYINLDSINTPQSCKKFDFTVERVLNHKELENFALQIARGMKHLEAIPITHRDLAARNILISKKKVLKISDFGLSRRGPYINNRTKKLPLRWMALESIQAYTYDNKSDVWSFAIVLWEIATLGAFPYENIPDEMVPFYLENGKRLSKPVACTDELYSLMLRCWSRDKNLRPSFAELVELLDVKKTRVYVDFSQLNPEYVFPPTHELFTNQNVPPYLHCL